MSISKSALKTDAVGEAYRIATACQRPAEGEVMRLGLLAAAGSGALALCLAEPALAQADGAPNTLSQVVVVGVAPLPGAQLNPNLSVGATQSASAADIEQSHPADLTEFMKRSLASVYVNDIQNNPLQPDINYRGFTASPLLGTPQGLSVYMDGVRLNQPFGDVVSWDLIPRAAISSIALAPGSNPLFGRNTLGGALSIQTKDGRSNPGAVIQGGYGSYARSQIEVEDGGSATNGVNWYLTASHFQEHGWRDASPSKASQAFGKLGWSDAMTDVALSAAVADTNLTGNGLQEQRFLDRDYASVYTKPDNTKNQSQMLNLTVQRQVSRAISFSGDAYWRHVRTKTFNGDINDDSLEESVYQPSAAERTALAGAGFTGFPTSGETAANTPFPSWRCIANGLLNTEPNEKCDALLNRSATAQTDGGASAQMAITAPLGSLANQTLLGGAFDQSRAHFVQSSQFGYLTSDRGVVGIGGPGAFADGSQNSENAYDARVNLTGRTTNWSLYAADVLSLSSALQLSVSGRFDHTRVENRDAITPGGGPGSLDGDHVFKRFNPAVGLTWTANAALSLYGGYTEASRAPSAIELGCSDPNNPCRLPNALAGDPPLSQVVTKTLEAGLRGQVGGWRWNAGAFRADNHDDILFVTDSVSGFGYFKNFGQTRRQGIELGLNGRLGPVDLGANYTYLDATYRSPEIVDGEGNSTNNGPAPGFEGDIAIKPGDRLPLIPRDIFKANARWAATKTIAFNTDMIAMSGAFARGNENNLHKPDGVYYLGPGRTKGYAVFNLGGEWRPTTPLKIFVQIDNLFDREYFTAAQLGATGFTDAGAFIARPFAAPVVSGDRPVRHATFYSPGAPRTAWVGVRYSF